MSAVELYEYSRDFDFCPRLANFTKVYVLLKIACVHHGARFLATLPGRTLFYTFRYRLAFFNERRAALEASKCHCMRRMEIPPAIKFMARCPRRKTDDAQLDLLSTEVRKMRGPHVLDLFAFMHLSKNLGNDLALLIFDFV